MRHFGLNNINIVSEDIVSKKIKITLQNDYYKYNNNEENRWRIRDKK